MKCKKAAMLAKMDGKVEFHEKELVEDWILITYDLPVTKEGNAARSKFLHLAPHLGAMMHTRSVYFMPQTQQSEMAALELSRIGKVFVWTSNLQGEKSKELTEIYDSRIKDEIKVVLLRLNRIRKHIKEERWGFAQRMIDGTIQQFNLALYAVIQRGNKKMMEAMIDIRKEIIKLQEEVA
jgi:hypothetical protein